MSKRIAGRIVAFKNGGEGDQVTDLPVLVEVTEFGTSGLLEVAFDTNLPGKPRVYLSLSLPDLLAVAMAEHGSSGA